MVKRQPASMLRVVLAFTLTTVVAILPLTVMVTPFGTRSGYGETVLTTVPVVALAAAVAVGTVVAGARRRLRPAQG